MTRKLDIAKVEAALKRAAEQGVNGPPEARAGRFWLDEIDAEVEADFAAEEAEAKRISAE